MNKDQGNKEQGIKNYSYFLSSISYSPPRSLAQQSALFTCQNPPFTEKHCSGVCKTVYFVS